MGKNNTFNLSNGNYKYELGFMALYLCSVRMLTVKNVLTLKNCFIEKMVLFIRLANRRRRSAEGVEWMIGHGDNPIHAAGKRSQMMQLRAGHRRTDDRFSLPPCGLSIVKSGIPSSWRHVFSSAREWTNGIFFPIIIVLPTACLRQRCKCIRCFTA